MITRVNDESLKGMLYLQAGKTTTLRIQPASKFQLQRIHCIDGYYKLNQHVLLSSIIVQDEEQWIYPASLLAVIAGCQRTTLWIPATSKPIRISIDNGSSQSFMLTLRLSGQYIGT